MNRTGVVVLGLGNNYGCFPQPELGTNFGAVLHLPMVEVGATANFQAVVTTIAAAVAQRDGAP